MNEYKWKTVSVVGFDELMRALDYADRKGFMPDAIKEEWDAFNWKPEQPVQQEPVACAHCNGSGRMVRDPDIGTDQECFVCEGSGFYEELPPHSAQGDRHDD